MYNFLIERLQAGCREATPTATSGGGNDGIFSNIGSETIFATPGITGSPPLLMKSLVREVAKLHYSWITKSGFIKIGGRTVNYGKVS